MNHSFQLKENYSNIPGSNSDPAGTSANPQKIHRRSAVCGQYPKF